MNRNSHRGLFLALLMAGLVSIAPSLFAQRGGGPGGMRGGGDRLAALNLSTEQKAQIDAIHAQMQSQTESLRQQLDAIRTQMQEARRANDQARIDALRAQAEPLHTQMKAYRDQTHAQIRALLTPEQAAKFDAMQEARGIRGQGQGECDGQGHGRRGGKGGRGAGGEGRHQGAGSTGSTSSPRQQLR